MRRPSAALIGCIALAIVLVGCGGSSTATIPHSTPSVPADAASATAPKAVFAGLIDVGGYRLHILCAGAGEPTVVLDSGGGGDWRDWGKVLTETAMFTRVCAYDRAGRRDSDPAPTPRTSQAMVDDLHHLLVNAGIAGPYLLVGASWGGMNVRLYASQYPDEITGLVLVDSVHPDVFGRWLAALPEPAPGEDPTLTQTRQDLTGILNDPSWGPEQIDFPTSIEQVRASGSLGDLPLVVLTAARQIELYDALPGELSATFQRIWLEAQADLVRLSSAGRQIIAVNSGHNIANDEPGVVIDAIRSLVTEARAR